MNKFTHLSQFVQNLFDRIEIAEKATRVIEGILKARSPRLNVRTLVESQEICFCL